jgi:cytosine deaminase
MPLDVVLAHGRVSGYDATLRDIAISDGRIVEVQPNIASDGPRIDLGGRVVTPGFIETHIHLDKSNLLGVCGSGDGSLAAAVASVAAAKRDFTEDDVYARASRTLEKAIMHGTTRMRTHIEVDPRVGLTSLYALQRLKRDYAWAIDIELCAFPQEGLLDDPGCEDVVVDAMSAGADVIGGAPYMDTDSHGHIRRIFDIARRFDVDIDMHLDFSLDPSHLDLEEVCRCTDAFGWGARVAIGHVSKLSAIAPDRLESIAKQLASSGVALTVLPSTDLFLMGREYESSVPRGMAPAHLLVSHGVTCSISTNNVLNPFTPYGDCSLVRMANLYANVAQIGSPQQMEGCLEMITFQSARLLGHQNYGVIPGNPADLVVLDCFAQSEAVAEIAPVLFGYKNGRRTFERPAASLNRP